MTKVSPNGTDYSDDGTAERDMRGGGHRLWLLPMIGDTLVEVGAAVGASSGASLSAAAAAESAAAAAGSAAAAAADRVQTGADRAGTATALAAAQALVGSAGTGTATGLVYTAAAKNLVTAPDVVAVHVYETALDSDGGTWTARPAGSWYWEALNSATRGATRRFPRVALIVVRAVLGGSVSITIYDAHDLDVAGVPRLWWAATGTTASRLGDANAVFALNGRVYVTKAAAVPNTSRGLLIIDFANDFSENLTNTSESINHGRFTGGVRGFVQGTVSSKPTGPLVSNQCYGVHVRVLPGGLLDGAGLLVPTVAVATAAGASVIHPPGMVHDVTETDGFNAVQIGADGSLWLSRATTRQLSVGPMPYADTSRAAWVRETYSSATGVDLVLSGTTSARHRPVEIDSSTWAVMSDAGLSLIARDAGRPSAGMVARVAIDHATGWQPGDIRGAWLCDSAMGSIAGSGELVTNGDFSDGATGWSASNGTISVSGGEMTVTTTGVGNSNAAQVITTVPGQTYMLMVTGRLGTNSNWQVSADNAVSPFQNLASTGNRVETTATPIFLSFVAVSASTRIFLRTYSLTAGRTAIFDDVSVRVGLPDRSHKNKGLQVNGTLTRTALPCGLVAVSGFSAGNYLWQPYNPDLDYTSDFCVIAWIRTTDVSSINRHMIDRCDTSTAGARWRLVLNSSGYPSFWCRDATTNYFVGIPTYIPDTGWRMLAGVRRGAVLELWLDGVLGSSVPITGAGDFSNAAAIAAFGVRADGWEDFGPNGQLLAVRTAAYAPTPTQIRQMYNDERALLIGGTPALLGGTSNNITALASNVAAGTLAAGTGDGVSVFARLGRVQYLDGASGGAAIGNDAITALSASGPHLLVGTAAGAGVIGDGVIARDLMVPAGRPRASPTDGPGVVTCRGVTTDATPTDLTPRIAIGEREAVTLDVTVQARTYGAASTQGGSYRRLARYVRDAGGSVTLAGSVQTIGTDQETTAGMDVALAIDTTAQTVAVRVTGVAATRMVWVARVVVTRISEDLTYAQ